MNMATAEYEKKNLKSAKATPINNIATGKVANTIPPAKTATGITAKPAASTKTGVISTTAVSNKVKNAPKPTTLKPIPNKALNVPKKKTVATRNIGKVIGANDGNIGKVLPKSKGAGKISSNKQKATNKKAKTSTKKSNKNARNAYRKWAAANKNAKANKSKPKANKSKPKGKKTTNNKSTFNLSKKTQTAVNNVDKRYKKYEDLYNANIDKQAKRDTEASNAQYSQSANSAAIRNAVQKKELQRQMYRNGITGGASETTMMNAANNYATQQTKISTDKAAAANKIRAQAQASKDSFKLSNSQARDTARESAKDRVYNKYENWLKRQDDLRKERKADKRYKAETKYNHKQDRLARKDRLNERKYNRKVDTYNRYAATVGGYDTVKSVNKQIRKIKKSGKGKWKLKYLRKQRADIRRQKKEDRMRMKGK